MKNKQPLHPLDGRIQRVEELLEQLVAIQMYTGGATQRAIADNMGTSIGKVNGLVKGVKPPKNLYGKED